MRIFILSLFLSSCIVTTNTVVVEEPLCNYEKLNSTEVSEIISLSRGACFGECSTYFISIFSDNSAVYHGKRFVEKNGTIKFELTDEEINQILDKANKINFCTLKDEYSEPITDLPTTYIQVFDKKIRDYCGAPAELKELEFLIDEICFRYIN